MRTASMFSLRHRPRGSATSFLVPGTGSPERARRSRSRRPRAPASRWRRLTRADTCLRPASRSRRVDRGNRRAGHGASATAEPSVAVCVEPLEVHEPLNGRSFTAQRTTPESVQITNISSGADRPVRVRGRERAVAVYEFKRGTVLQPGQAISARIVQQRPGDGHRSSSRGWGFNQLACFADAQGRRHVAQPARAPRSCAPPGAATPVRRLASRYPHAGKMRRTRCIPLLGLLLALLILAPAAEARRGPCIPGIKRPTCHVWTAKVMAVADGDTVNVRVRQNGRWSERRDVRLTGVQAMELRSYSRVGAAGAAPATRAPLPSGSRPAQGPAEQAPQDPPGRPPAATACRTAGAGGCGARSPSDRAAAGMTPAQC